MMRRVVVSGGGGFVGGFVARFLAAQGCFVTATTRREMGIAFNDTPGLTWLKTDLSNSVDIATEYDALIHCAAEIPALCPEPGVLYQSNLMAGENLFNKVVSTGVRSIVFMSSMSVYGTISDDVVNENTIPVNPDSYGRSKFDLEQILKAHVGRGLYSGLSIRLPGTVGRGSHHNFLSDALKRVLAGESIDAKNPDTAFNNIVYVGDLAKFLHTWILAPRSGYSVTNLGAVAPMSIREVLTLMFRTAGQEERLTFSGGGKKSFLISMDRAKELGYRPSTVRQSVQAFVRDSLSK